MKYLQKGNKELYKEGKNCKIIKERNYEKKVGNIKMVKGNYKNVETSNKKEKNYKKEKNEKATTEKEVKNYKKKEQWQKRKRTTMKKKRNSDESKYLKKLSNEL